MIIVPDMGILTDQGSPPSLQFICTATLVATLIRPLGLFSTVEVMHWLGVGCSMTHFFLTAA
mgnify:CR=1 FL=1